MLLDWLGSFCAAWNAYYIGVLKWGDETALSRGPWSLGLNPPVTGLCALIVQCCESFTVQESFITNPPNSLCV